MGCGCKEDFHTEHAELIHPARDIAFQLGYDNAGDPAIILDIGKKNVQFALESYWSKLGIPITHEIPAGAKDALNLDFDTAFEFIPGSLQVVLSGISLNGNQADAERDYDEKPNRQGFILRLDANKPWRLNTAPLQNESLHVNYNKRITFDTKGGT